MLTAKDRGTQCGQDVGTIQQGMLEYVVCIAAEDDRRNCCIGEKKPVKGWRGPRLFGWAVGVGVEVK